MREKIIFDGRIDGSPKEVQDIIDLFMFENIGVPGIDYRVENENQKHLYIIYPPQGNNQRADKIINGYTEISTLSLTESNPINLRIISCRYELDLLFFQISQRIQAKFIVKDFPPAILTTPWKELVTSGFISPLVVNEKDILLSIDKNADPNKLTGKYGSDRDLTTEDVINIVKSCKAFQLNKGTINSYYVDVLPPEVQGKFSLDTLKSWLKQKRFQPPGQKHTRKSTR